MKKAWATYPLCKRCKKRRTKGEVCSKCAPVVRREKKKDKDGLTKEQRSEFIHRARVQYENEGSIEIDDEPVLSVADPKEGAYVQAWVWVYAKEKDT